MTTSRKQEIYGEILERILPYARNVQTWTFLRRVRTNLYAELELVHNLGRIVTYPEIRDADIFWLNTQGYNYVCQCRIDSRKHVSAESIMALLKELANLVPSEVRQKLRVSEMLD